MPEDAEPTAPLTESKDNKSSKLVVRLLIVAILIMIATPLITIFAFRSMSQEVMQPEQKQSKLTEVALPRIQVNVAGTNATRYAQVDTVLRISAPDMQKLFKEQSSEAPDGLQREIVAEVIRIISDKPLNTLLSTEGKRELANEIKGKVNDLIADYTSGMITDVYFYGFLIQ